MKKLIIGSVLAALALHAYGVVSFMFLGWHMTKPVKDPVPLTNAIKATITETGVYALPNCVNPETGAALEMDAVMKAASEGPFLFAVIRPGESKRPFISMILANLVYCFLAALVLGVILMRVPLGYACLVKMSGMIGLFVALLVWLPQYNWYEFPFAWCLSYMVDSVLMGVIAGAVLGKFVVQKGAVCPK